MIEWAPTSEQRKLAIIKTACGFTQQQIATEFGCDRKTLRKHLRKELKEGKLHANAMMAQSLFKKGLSTGAGSVAAAIFWMKTQAGWKETAKYEHSGPGGTPLQPPSLSITFPEGGPGTSASETPADNGVETSQ